MNRYKLPPRYRRTPKLRKRKVSKKIRTKRRVSRKKRPRKSNTPVTKQFIFGESSPARRGNVTVLSLENPLPPSELEDVVLPEVDLDQMSSPSSSSDSEDDFDDEYPVLPHETTPVHHAVPLDHSAHMKLPPNMKIARVYGNMMTETRNQTAPKTLPVNARYKNMMTETGNQTPPRTLPVNARKYKNLGVYPGLGATKEKAKSMTDLRPLKSIEKSKKKEPKVRLTEVIQINENSNPTMAESPKHSELPKMSSRSKTTFLSEEKSSNSNAGDESESPTKSKDDKSKKSSDDSKKKDLESQEPKKKYFETLKERYFKEKENFERKHYNSFQITLNSVLILGILYNTISVPYRIGFEQYTIVLLKVFDIIFDIIFYFGILTKFITKPYEIKSQWKAIKNFLLSFEFVLAVLTMLVPVDWFMEYPVARVSRIIGFFAITYYLAPIEPKLEMYINLIFFRIIKYSILMVVLIHVFSCVWFWIARTLESQFNNFIVPKPLPSPFFYILLEPPAETTTQFAYSWVRLKQYLGSLWFGSYYIVGFAAPFPQDFVQSIYSVVCVVCGAGLFATLIGTVSSILNSLGKTKQMFNEKMTQIKNFMKFKNVDKRIQRNVGLYYDILEARGRAMVGADLIFNDLDIALKRRVNLFLHRELVKKVDIFRRCEEITSGLFIEDVCNYLKYILLLKGFTIVRFGEIGKTMYFIGKGEVDVISKDGVKLVTLGRGNFFGEIALFLQKKRTASIVARKTCELYELHLDDLQRILQIHHQCKILFYKEARDRYRQLKREEKKHKKLERRKRMYGDIRSITSATSLSSIMGERERRNSVAISQGKLGDKSDPTRGSVSPASRADSAISPGDSRSSIPSVTQSGDITPGRVPRVRMPVRMQRGRKMSQGVGDAHRVQMIRSSSIRSRKKEKEIRQYLHRRGPSKKNIEQAT